MLEVQEKKLSELKQGDQVYIRFRDNLIQILTVERLTKTQIITNNGSRYRRDSGIRIGTHKSFWQLLDKIMPITNAVLEEKEFYDNINMLMHYAKAKFSSFKNIDNAMPALRLVAEIIESDYLKAKNKS